MDGSDYTRIDSGFLKGASGWFNGDFNYDGVINGSDYTLIDNACNRQGVSLAAQIATQTKTVFPPSDDAAAFVSSQGDWIDTSQWLRKHAALKLNETPAIQPIENS